jgi:putative membrane protein
MNKWNRTQRTIFFLTCVYVVGIFGICAEVSRDQFLLLTPLNLLFTTGIYLWSNEGYTKQLLSASAIVALIGYFIEVAGVKTGVLFGSYYYGPTLGPHLLEVPPTMGANWVLLSLSSYGIFFSLDLNKYLKMGLAAALMVGLDYFIEPVAMGLDFWQWEGGVVPFKNYVMWFVTAYIIQFILYKMLPSINQKTSLFVFSLQFVFFLIIKFFI